LLQQKDPKTIILNRIEQFSEILNIPKQRIHDWHYVKTVLCWVWCIEDNLNATHFECILEFLD
jgi:streptomycin 6-kinase